MSNDFINIHRDQGVLELVFNRPQSKNALTLAMYDTLTSALVEANTDDETVVVLLRGEGGNFTSGNDLNDFLKKPPTGEDSSVFRFLQALRKCEKPVLACVEGHAIGIGTTMLLHCDLVYAATTARFQLPFVDLALVPEAGSSLLLPRMLGYQRAAELLFFGDRFKAEQAMEWGIVNSVHAPPALLNEVRGLARKLARKPPVALRQTKALLKRATDTDIEAAMQAEAEVFVERLRSAEVAEVIAAFFEKRKSS